jgi:uncharacterized damage-inducible protein DinB
MDSNTHSTQGPAGPADPHTPPDELEALSALLDRLDACDLDRLPDLVRAQRVRQLRWHVERLEGQWLKELAGVDARGAAGAEGVKVGSTAGWLRARLRMAADALTELARRALEGGQLPRTGGVRPS